MTGLFWFVLGILTGGVVMALVVLAFWETLQGSRRRGFINQPGGKS